MERHFAKAKPVIKPRMQRLAKIRVNSAPQYQARTIYNDRAFGNSKKQHNAT